MAEDLTLRREIVEISGGRPLYNYTFELDGHPMPEMSAEDVVQTVEPAQNPAGSQAKAEG